MFSFAYFCILFAFICIWICAYKCIFVICIFLYIIAYEAYILHISFVHIVHIFCIFGTAYSCIFLKNGYFCILMPIMHVYAYFELTIVTESTRQAARLAGLWWSLGVRVPSTVCRQNCCGGDSIVAWLWRGLSRAAWCPADFANAQRCWLRR